MSYGTGQLFKYSDKGAMTVGITEEAKIAHLAMIQGVIARMASDAQSTKTLAVTVAAAIIALAQAGGTTTHWVAVCGAILMVLFWFLTAKSLHVERAYRALYDDVRLDMPVDPFSMEWRPFAPRVPHWFKLGFTSTVLVPYIAAFAILIFIATVTWNVTPSETILGVDEHAEQVE